MPQHLEMLTVYVANMDLENAGLKSQLQVNKFVLQEIRKNFSSSCTRFKKNPKRSMHIFFSLTCISPSKSANFIINIQLFFLQAALNERDILSNKVKEISSENKSIKEMQKSLQVSIISLITFLLYRRCEFGRTNMLNHHVMEFCLKLKYFNFPWFFNLSKDSK